MPTDESNLAAARRYLAALEGGADADELAAFFAPDVIQEEFPNRLVPTGARRDLASLLEGRRRGQEVLSSETYEIRNAMASGNQVALEVLWSGTLAKGLGSLPAGGSMHAHFAVFLDFADGKIVAQRNYDCFEPW
jgi:ketosteroid isomerase-like protein